MKLEPMTQEGAASRFLRNGLTGRFDEDGYATLRPGSHRR